MKRLEITDAFRYQTDEGDRGEMPASEFICVHPACCLPGVEIVLVEGRFEGHAYCGLASHRQSVQREAAR